MSNEAFAYSGHAIDHVKVLEPENKRLKAEIARLEALLEAAELDAGRHKNKYEMLRGMQNAEIARLEAVNAELVRACRAYMARQRGGVPLGDGSSLLMMPAIASLRIRAAA